MKKKSLVVYIDFYESTKGLPDCEKGQLYDAIFQYCSGESVRELTPVCQMAFSFMRAQFDRDNAKYQAITDKNRSNGAKGGRPKKEFNPTEPKKPSGLFGLPEKPKKADNDNVDDNVDDNVLSDDNNNHLSLKTEKLQKKQPDSLQFPFSGTEFIKAWEKLTSLPKWRKKPLSALQESLNILSRYEEEFAIELISKALSGNWQGVVFANTDEDYLKWRNSKKSVLGIGQQHKQTKNQRKCNW